MLSNSSCSRNNLNKNRRISLQDVLTELTLDTSMLEGPTAHCNSNFTHHPNMERHSTMNSFAQDPGPLRPFSSSLKNPTRSIVPFPPITTATTSAALGLTSEELLLAAVSEKQMLDQARREVIRQRALAEEGLKRHQFNESLVSLLQGGLAAGHRFIKPPPDQKMKIDEASRKKSKATLETLGTSLKKKDVPYVDVSTLTDPDPSDARLKKTRGGVTEHFPEKLHRMLREVEDCGKTAVVSFFPHGRAFAVHDPERFASEIMPKYFRHGKISSFQRQLNLYGFTRINAGPDTGGYYHELFLRGRPALCLPMRRVGVPKGDDRRKQRETKTTEPNFYEMRAVSFYCN